MTAPVLVCAATRTEARAVAKGLEDARGFEVLTTGMGMAAAHAALTKRLDDATRPAPSRIVSTGFAGSRVASLPMGAVAVGTSVARIGSETLALVPRIAGIAARFATTDGVVGADERVEADAVDMESYAWVRIAKARGIDAEIARVVSDTIEQPIPSSIVQLTGGRVVQGVGAMVARPLELARFVARTSRLTGTLTALWAAIARG